VIDVNRIMADLDDRLFRGLTAACIELQNEAKQVLSVAAPRKMVTAGKKSKSPGVKYYRATTPAIAGAPPRKLSGRLRASVTREIDKDTLTGRVGTNVIYGRRHEFGFPRSNKPHPWLAVAAANIDQRLAQLIGAGMSMSIGVG
jgi:phage gpG-like protein